MHDILSFDPEIGKTLRELHALVCRKQYLESIGGDHPDVIAELCFRGTPIEDLCLDFTLPGYPDYVLRQGDENVQFFESLFHANFWLQVSSHSKFFCGLIAGGHQ